MKNFELFLRENEIKFLKDYPLSYFTTFGVGGKASFIVFLKNMEELEKTLKKIKEYDLNYFVLGRGANLLVSDKGFEGIFLKLDGDFREFSLCEGELICGSGALISRVSIFTVLKGYWGFENFLDLPGTIGGGLIMNAGCYGKEISSHLISLNLLNNEGEVLNLKKEDINFSYRNSGLKGKGIILGGRFFLEKGEMDKILKSSLEVIKKRKENIPGGKSAGSIFKNPENCKVRELLKRAGLEGFRIGGAKFSEKHPNIIINEGSATAGDIYNLIKEAKERVFNLFNLKLEEEIVYVGF